jgi:MFS family permease
MSKREIPTWAILAVCCTAQFMVVLDITIVNVALPNMRSGLGLSATGQQWVVNAYTITFAGFLLSAVGPLTCSAAGAFSSWDSPCSPCAASSEASPGTAER